jgi:hypothetical protein
VCIGLRQKLALNRYRTIGIYVILRLAALALLLITTPIEALFAQTETTTTLRADESDAMVVRARQNLEQIQRMVTSGALPLMRLTKAQEDVQNALDMSMLKKSLYSSDVLPEQADEMVAVAQRIVFRKQRALTEMEELASAGVIARSEAEASGADLEQARQELEWAQTRAKLVQQMTEAMRIEKGIASLELQAQSHPEWVGSLYTKYDGSGVFSPADLRTVETAYLAHFSRPLPISADGETAVHRSLGFDHRGRVDVALNPDQPEGSWLIHYLQSKRIPYFAFRAAVPHKATGAHIHMGPQSTKLAVSD